MAMKVWHEMVDNGVLLEQVLGGSHHCYTVRHAPSRVTKACYKYNIGCSENATGDFIQAAVT